jgi:hypothetical protein
VQAQGGIVAGARITSGSGSPAAACFAHRFARWQAGSFHPGISQLPGPKTDSAWLRGMRQASEGLGRPIWGVSDPALTEAGVGLLLACLAHRDVQPAEGVAAGQ